MIRNTPACSGVNLELSPGDFLHYQLAINGVIGDHTETFASQSQHKLQKQHGLSNQRPLLLRKEPSTISVHRV